MSAIQKYNVKYMIVVGNTGSEIHKLWDGSEGRRGERSREIKKEEDAKNKAAKTDDSREI